MCCSTQCFKYQINYAVKKLQHLIKNMGPRNFIHKSFSNTKKRFRRIKTSTSWTANYFCTKSFQYSNLTAKSNMYYRSTASLHTQCLSNKHLANAKRPCDCSAMPTSEKFTVQLSALYFRHDVIRQRCRDQGRDSVHRAC